MDELGYDDMDAFEATLDGSFEEWVTVRLRLLPICLILIESFSQSDRN